MALLSDLCVCMRGERMAHHGKQYGQCPTQEDEKDNVQRSRTQLTRPIIYHHSDVRSIPDKRESFPYSPAYPFLPRVFHVVVVFLFSASNPAIVALP